MTEDSLVVVEEADLVINKMAGSTCTRCGKPRIIVNTYEEKVETSTVTYTITECSDPECQKLVNKTLLTEKRKENLLKMNKLKEKK